MKARVMVVDGIRSVSQGRVYPMLSLKEDASDGGWRYSPDFDAPSCERCWLRRGLIYRCRCAGGAARWTPGGDGA